jgi:electron transfer flavoprotein beta subunit
MIGSEAGFARAPRTTAEDGLTMNIVVLVKQVPDSGSERKLDPSDNTVARATADNDLVLCGAEATDAQLSVMPALLAERLGLPQLSGARKLTVEGGMAKIERQTDGGYWQVEAPLPAIVSTWDTINEPRYPSFKGIMAAKKKPVQTLTLADLGIDPGTVGLATATSKVVDFAGRPPKGEGVKVPDEGDGAEKLVGFLAAQKIV